MSNIYSFGKNGKAGNIDFDKLKSGITKRDLEIEGNSELSSIFDSIDNSGSKGKGNGKLDRDELSIFINKIKELAGIDENETELSSQEAEEFEIEGRAIGRKGKNDLFDFLNRLSQTTKDISKVVTDNEGETVVYKDGHIEKTLSNGIKIITRQTLEGTYIITEDAQGRLLEEVLESSVGKTITKYNPKTGKKTKVVNQYQFRSETIEYDEDGKTPKSKIEDQGTRTFHYIYDKAKGCYIPSRYEVRYVDDKGGATEEITEYDVSQYDSVTKTGRVKWTTKTVDDKLVSKTVYTANGPKTIEYDGEGNTYVTVQPDETTAEVLAEKFGCSADDIARVNDGRTIFSAGEKIKIPGLLEPDAAILQGRKTADEIAQEQPQEPPQSGGRRTGGSSRTGGIGRTRGTKPSAPQNPNPEVPGGEKLTPQQQKNYEIAKKRYEAAAKIADALVKNIKDKDALGKINSENVTFVMAIYYKKTGRTLALDIINNASSNVAGMKQLIHGICSKLAARAKELGVKGIYFSDFSGKKINKKELLDWIGKAYAKVMAAEKRCNPEIAGVFKGEGQSKIYKQKDLDLIIADSTKIADEFFDITNPSSHEWKINKNGIKKIISDVTMNRKEALKEKLKEITPTNVAFVVEQFAKNMKEKGGFIDKFNLKYNAKTLAGQLHYYGFDLKTIKEKLCKPLVEQAQNLKLQGIYHKQWFNLSTINAVSDWIEKISAKIRRAMGNVETSQTKVKVEGRKEKQPDGKIYTIKTITNESSFKDAGILKREETYDENGKLIEFKDFFEDGRIVREFYDKTLIENPVTHKLHERGRVREIVNPEVVKHNTLAPKSNLYAPVEMTITVPSDALTEAKQFAKALEENKAELMSELGIDNDTFNMLVRVALAIAEQETNFDHPKDPIMRGYYEAGKKCLAKAGNTFRDMSFGLTQIKYDDYMKNDEWVRHKFQDVFGINDPQQLYNPETCAIATVILLAKKLQEAKTYKYGIEAAQGAVVTSNGFSPKGDTIEKTYDTQKYTNHLTQEDILCYMWQGKAAELKDGTAQPLANIYTRNVRQYMKKYIINETPEARKAAEKQNPGKPISPRLSFTPMQNNGPMGSIVFMPKMYSNAYQITNTTQEVQKLKQLLNKNHNIDSDLKQELIQVVENGEISFEYGLDEKEITTMTNNDVKILLKHIKRIKSIIESKTNVKFADGIDENEATAMAKENIRMEIRQAEWDFKREYLNSRSKRVSTSSVPSKNILDTPMNNKPSISRKNNRRGFEGSATKGVSDSGVNTSNTTEASAKLAQSAKSVANRRNSGGHCLDGVKEAMRSAGIDISDMSSYGSTPKYVLNWFLKHSQGENAMFEEVQYINVGGGNARQINSTDLPNLPAGYFVIFIPDADYERKTGHSYEGHIAITNGNGQGYADETDNLDWGGYTGSSGSGKGEHGTFRVFRLTDKWKVGSNGKLVFGG